GEINGIIQRQQQPGQRDIQPGEVLRNPKTTGDQGVQVEHGQDEQRYAAEHDGGNLAGLAPGRATRSGQGVEQPAFPRGQQRVNGRTTDPGGQAREQQADAAQDGPGQHQGPSGGVIEAVCQRRAQTGGKSGYLALRAAAQGLLARSRAQTGHGQEPSNERRQQEPPSDRCRL